jgi:hypothetical protein
MLQPKKFVAAEECAIEQVAYPEKKKKTYVMHVLNSSTMKKKVLKTNNRPCSRQQDKPMSVHVGPS